MFALIVLLHKGIEPLSRLRKAKWLQAAPVKSRDAKKTSLPSSSFLKVVKARPSPPKGAEVIDSTLSYKAKPPSHSATFKASPEDGGMNVNTAINQ